MDRQTEQTKAFIILDRCSTLHLPTLSFILLSLAQLSTDETFRATKDRNFFKQKN